jgi:hypothetical protein
MEITQLLKPTAAQYATFVEKGFSLDLDFLNAYDWSTVLVEQNGKYGLINCIGEQLVSPNFENFQMMSGHDMRIGERVVAQLNGKWGIITLDGGEGVWVVEPAYDYIGYPNTLTSFQKDNKWGVMNIATKEWILPLVCDKIYGANGFLFVNGIGVYEIGEKSGLILDNGEFTEAIYDEIDLVAEEFSKARIGDLWGFIAKDGQLVQDPDEAYFYEYID